MRRLAALTLFATLAACGDDRAPERLANLTTAPDRTGESRRGFLRADMNDDGVVTRAELGEEAAGRFARIDADRDGTASPTELASRRGRGQRRGTEDTASRLVAAITRAEYRDRALARFDRRDGDHDGRLEGDELRRR